VNTNRRQQERILDDYETGLGPEIRAAIRKPGVTGIKVAGEDGKLFVKEHSTKWVDTLHVVPLAVRRSTLNMISSELQKSFNEEQPSLSGELPLTGDRVQAWCPPIADYSLVIRRHSSQVFSLEDYVDAQIMTQQQANTLRRYVHEHKNMVWCGAVDSGKTTACNACLAEIEGTEHVFIVEDTKELKFLGANVTRLQTANSVATLQSLARDSLRGDYDRLVIGETRGAEGVEVIKIWNAGRRGGFTTVHAESAAGAFVRFAMFCQEARLPPLWMQIEAAIDVVIHIAMTQEGRKITEIREVQHEDIDIPIKFKRQEEMYTTTH